LSHAPIARQIGLASWRHIAPGVARIAGRVFMQPTASQYRCHVPTGSLGQDRLMQASQQHEFGHSIRIDGRVKTICDPNPIEVLVHFRISPKQGNGSRDIGVSCLDDGDVRQRIQGRSGGTTPRGRGALACGRNVRCQGRQAPRFRPCLRKRRQTASSTATKRDSHKRIVGVILPTTHMRDGR